MEFKRITDKSFQYVSSVETDISKTFDRIRKQQARQKKLSAKEVNSTNQNVVSLVKK